MRSVIFFLVVAAFSVSGYSQETACTAGFKFDSELGSCTPKNIYKQYYDADYQSRLTNLSSQALRSEYARKITAWGVACIPDAIKIGITATLETLPVGSALSTLGLAFHSLGDRNDGGYETRLDDKTPEGHVITNMILGGPISYPAIKIYDKVYTSLFGKADLSSDNDKKGMAFYYSTRIFAHDSFDPKYASLCSKQAVAVSQIRQELTNRKSSAQVQVDRQTVTK